jgi:hypothetical protein
MIRRHLLAVLAVGLCLPLVQPAAGARAQRQILVTVLADANGPLRTLTAADFVVTEDKKTREVTGIVLAPYPLSVALLVDTSQPAQGGSIPTITRDLRDALTMFARTLQTASPDTQISLGEFAGAAVTRVPFTNRTSELEQAFSRLYLDPRSDAVLLEAFTDVAAKLGQMPPPRRAIVTIDFNSPETSRESEQRPAVEAVERIGATVWATSIGSAGGRNSREMVLNALTDRTGGQRQVITDTISLQNRLKSIANSLLSQYELTYIRPDNVSAVKDVQISTKRGAKVLKTRWAR